MSLYTVLPLLTNTSILHFVMAVNKHLVAHFPEQSELYNEPLIDGSLPPVEQFVPEYEMLREYHAYWKEYATRMTNMLFECVDSGYPFTFQIILPMGQVFKFEGFGTAMDRMQLDSLVHFFSHLYSFHLYQFTLAAAAMEDAVAQNPAIWDKSLSPLLPRPDPGNGS